MRKNLVNLFLEMLHHQVVLLFSVFVLGLGLEATQFASMSGSETVDVFGQRRWNQVQHVVGFEILPNLEMILAAAFDRKKITKRSASQGLLDGAADPRRSLGKGHAFKSPRFSSSEGVGSASLFLQNGCQRTTCGEMSVDRPCFGYD